MLGAIAAGYHKIGQSTEADRVLEAALATAQSIGEDRNRCDAVAEVAAAESRLKRKDAAKKTFELALESARKIQDPYSKAYALMEIAQKLSKAQLHGRTHQVLKEAEAVAKKITKVDLQRQTDVKIHTLMHELPGPG